MTCCFLGAYDHGSLDADFIHIRQVFFRGARERGVIQIVGVVFEFGGEFGDGSRKAMVMDVNSTFAGEGSGGERVDFVRHDVNVNFPREFLRWLSVEWERVVSPRSSFIFIASDDCGDQLSSAHQISSETSR